MRTIEEWTDEAYRRQRDQVVWMTCAELDEIAALCGKRRRDLPTCFVGLRVALIDQPPKQADAHDSPLGYKFAPPDATVQP